jgi:High potential iron-sulfur protein
MSSLRSPGRRRLLQSLALGVPLAALGMNPRAHAAASARLLDAASPEARALRYVEDAANAHGAAPGSRCANCALYQGTDGSKQGPCQVFPGREVNAAGWCTSWAAQM